jgi:PPOX class probable F420-dependent enzyme
MPQEMTADQRRAFLNDGTRTAILATVRADGRPHAAPVWYALDGDDVLINTGEDTVKGRAVQRDPRVTVVVDDPTPPYAFVMIEGVAEISRDHDEIQRGSTTIGRRYLDTESADAWVLHYATSPGKVLVRVRPTNLVAVDRVGG